MEQNGLESMRFIRRKGHILSLSLLLNQQLYGWKKSIRRGWKRGRGEEGSPESIHLR